MSAEHGMPITDEEAVQQFTAFYERAQESAEDMMLRLHKAASDYTATDLIDVARMDECRVLVAQLAQLAYIARILNVQARDVCRGDADILDQMAQEGRELYQRMLDWFPAPVQYSCTAVR